MSLNPRVVYEDFIRRDVCVDGDVLDCLEVGLNTVPGTSNHQSYAAVELVEACELLSSAPSSSVRNACLPH